MKLTTYNQLLGELATGHRDIRATPDNQRFRSIFISSDFVQKQLDLGQFYESLRSGLQAPLGQAFLVAENYQTDYLDNDGDYFSRELRGAYLVLRLAPLDDYPAREQAVAACETIAEQLLAALVYRLRVDDAVDISVRDAWAEHLGPLADGYVGVRMNFSWKESATEDLTYDPTLFDA